MPSRPPRQCNRPMCKGLSRDGSNYCPKHKPEQKSGWSRYREKTGNRHQAGYGHKWDKLRKAVLIRDRHLCQVCLKLGVMTEAKQVDHILNKAAGGTDDMHNLQSICWPCHKRKTAQESKEGKK